MPESGHHDLASVTPDGDRRPILLALALLSIFFVAEIIAALLGSSLALFADAGHMLTDIGALAMSAWAIRLTQRPAQGRFTYGLHRAEILSAAVNGVTLVAVALLVAVEAITRLVSPHHVDGGVVLVVALLGVATNLVVTLVLARANHRSLNVRGAYLHVLTDLYAFIATAIAGLLIIVTHWERFDAIASLLVVVLMAFAAWKLLREAGRILLQGAPDTINLDHVREHLLGVEHVVDVHDLHAWTLTSDTSTLSAHVVVEDQCFGSDHAPRILDALQACLVEHFSVEHATFQLEPTSHATHEGGLHP